MVEVYGDPINPSELIVPQRDGFVGEMKVSGANLFASGAKLFIRFGDETVELITSATIP